jgi:hypothetical protein
LAAGIGVINLASNHTFDAEERGFEAVRPHRIRRWRSTARKASSRFRKRINKRRRLGENNDKAASDSKASDFVVTVVVD